MRQAQETTVHELYLRASSITKKTAPLKLYANVVGKLTVERELHDDVYDRLRESTQDAVNQRMTRTTQFIDMPPDIRPNSKKRKEPPPASTIFRKPIRPSDKLMSTSNPPTLLNRTPAHTAQGSKELETPKRGVSSQEVREKKAKQKPNPTVEIMMKDESLNVNSRLSQCGIRDGETTQMTGTQGTSRESSGLSQKLAKYSPKPGDGEFASLKFRSARSSIQDDGSSRVGKLPTGDREGKNVSSEVVRRQHKKPEPSDSEREGRHPQPDMNKARAAGREEGTRIDHKSLQSKRKMTNRDDGDYVELKSLPQKRRKIEPSAANNTASTSLSRDEKPLGSITHQSNVEPQTQMNRATKDLSSLATPKKRKDSPSVPSKHGHHPKAKISSNMSSSYPLPYNDEGTRIRHGSTKIRRRSPIYTSSEDEELPVSDRVSSHSNSLATDSTLSHSHSPSNPVSRTASRSLLPRSVTTDHTALRERYSTTYVEYLTSLQKLVMQRRKVDQMLKTGDSGSAGSFTDSEGEVELLHPEELARLAADHRKRHEELVSIQQMFTAMVR